MSRTSDKKPFSTIKQRPGLPINLKDITIVGVTLPKKAKEFLQLDAVKATVSGGGHVGIKGEYNGCKDNVKWSGEGSISVDASIGSGVKAKIPKFIVLKGDLVGKTNLTEDLIASSEKISAKGEWGGLSMNGSLSGSILLQTQYNEIKPFSVSVPLIDKKTIPQFDLPMPSLNN
jgi:hypothetical protein